MITSFTLWFTMIVAMISITTAASTKCSSDSDCASNEGCLTSESKCYHRFNVSDFSVLKLVAKSSSIWWSCDTITYPNCKDNEDVTAFEGSALSPIFDSDLSTFITAQIKEDLYPLWWLSLSFASDRWVKSMKMVLSAPSYVPENRKDFGFFYWLLNEDNTEIGEDGMTQDVLTNIEDGKYQVHTFENSKEAKLPSAIHGIQIRMEDGGLRYCDDQPPDGNIGCIYYLHYIEILGSYASPSISAAVDISMVSIPEATVSTQPCCHDYGFMVKEDKVNIRDASSASCEKTITTQCCGNTQDYNDQYSIYDYDQYSSSEYEYRCGDQGEWYRADESQYYDEGLCDISWFNATKADIVGTVIDGENIRFDYSAIIKADDIGAVISLFDFCKCNYTINECEGEDIAVCGSQETYDTLFATDCWNNVSWNFTDDFQSEDCWKDTLQNNPEYQHLLWEPCGVESFHGMNTEFVEVSAEHIHNGECNCTYYVPPNPTTTTTDEGDAAQCVLTVLQVYIVTIITILAVVFA